MGANFGLLACRPFSLKAKKWRKHLLKLEELLPEVFKKTLNNITDSSLYKEVQHFQNDSKLSFIPNSKGDSDTSFSSNTSNVK